MSVTKPSAADRAVSRRTLLRAAAMGAASTALPLSAAEVLAAAQAQPACPTPLPRLTVPMPVFSLAERDRRWAAVRAAMARPAWNLDAIITSISDQWHNYARYLTQIRYMITSGQVPQVLFPRDPAKPVHLLTTAERHRDEWAGRLKAWAADGKLVLSADNGATPMAERLKALGLAAPGTRIGVAKLGGSSLQPEGLVSVTWLDALKAALPGVVFVPVAQEGTDPGPVEESGMVKGPEEVEVIRRSVAMTEAGLMAAVAAARVPGARQADLWWACYSTVFAATGEFATRISISLDASSNATIGDATDDPVAEGQICNQELACAWQGYGAQINHGFFVGTARTPGYGYYAALLEVGARIQADVAAFIRPGRTTYRELGAYFLKRRDELGAEGGGTIVHSGGVGYLNRPRLGPSGTNKDLDIVIAPGHCFDFKPSLTLKRSTYADVRESNRPVQLGEHYVVTAAGAQRLGTRKLEPIVTG